MEFFVIIIALVSLLIGGFSYWKSRKLKNDLKIGEQEIKRKMYELAILKELGERMGYSLNVQNIIDIISGSLHQFIEYSVVSYMLINPEKIIFKAHLEKSISKNFFIDIKQRMVKSLSALMDKDFSKVRIEEVLSGAILEENSKEPVSSFFNIPLVIADKVVGVLTVAHSKAGLYKEDEMTILYKIVGQASQAVTKLQEVVLEEQKKLNAMVESMTEGVVMTDKDYRIMVANPASKRNFDIEENKDVTIFDFIEKLEGKFNIRGSLEESVKLKKILVSKEVLINDKFLEITTLPVKNNFGINEEIVGGVVIFHDITKEKEVEKMKEDFTSMIAHELRSPIDQIKKISEVLRTEKIVKKDRNEYLDMVYSSSAGLLEMVNNLLDMAKLEAGKFEILKQFVRL